LPKQTADEHSLQAKWLSGVALKKFRLRTDHVLEMFDYVDASGDGEDPEAVEARTRMRKAVLLLLLLLFFFFDGLLCSVRVFR
jgi:hypothetical protein